MLVVLAVLMGEFDSAEIILTGHHVSLQSIKGQDELHDEADRASCALPLA